MRTTIIIALLTKCTIYENYDHGRSSHKNVMSLRLIGLLQWSQSSLLGQWSRSQYLKKCPIFEYYESYDHGHSPKRGMWFTVLTKIFYFWVFMRTVIMIATLFIRAAILNAVLTKYPILIQSSQRTAIMSRNPHISIVIISRPLPLTSNDPLIFFKSKHK